MRIKTLNVLPFVFYNLSTTLQVLNLLLYPQIALSEERREGMRARLELALDSPQGAGNAGETSVPGLAQIVLQMSEDALIGGIDIENASCAQSRLSFWQLTRMLLIFTKAPI